MQAIRHMSRSIIVAVELTALEVVLHLRLDFMFAHRGITFFSVLFVTQFRLSDVEALIVDALRYY